MSAVAELHIEAGWSAFDAGLYHRTLYHYARALELATKTGDAYLQALALSYGGLAAVEHGHPDDGLKMLQIGQVRAWEIPPDERRAVVVGENGRTAVEATALAESATARADLGYLDAAEADLVTARQLWRHTRFDPYSDLDRPAASLALRRGRLDLAESLAAASEHRSVGRGVAHVGPAEAVPPLSQNRCGPWGAHGFKHDPFSVGICGGKLSGYPAQVSSLSPTAPQYRGPFLCRGLAWTQL